MNQVDRGVREMSFVNCCLAAIRVSCQPKRSIKATAHRAGYDPFVAPSSFELVCDVIPYGLHSAGRRLPQL
jgi:hypothetical protein